MPEVRPVSLAPSSELTRQSASTERPHRFILFTDSWLTLQTYIQSCLKLPFSHNNFNSTYGPFADQTLITDTVEAMINLRHTTAEFGDPTLLKKKINQDVSYLLTAQPPAEIYSHIVWLALQIESVASTFKYTFENLEHVLGPHAGSTKARAQNLKIILIGPGGLVAKADDMGLKTQALIKKLARFEQNVGAANERVAHYTNPQSEIMTLANQRVGRYTYHIEHVLKPASQAALDAWTAYSIAAATCSVALALAGVLVIVLAPVPPGPRLAAGAGTLGIAAQNQHQLYNALRDQMATEDADKKKKVALAVDLSAFNLQLPKVGSSLADFSQNLSSIEGIWVDIAGKLRDIAANYSVEQLGDFAFVAPAFRIQEAQYQWGMLNKAAEGFTQHSLVDFRHLAFGDQIVLAA